MEQETQPVAEHTPGKEIAPLTAAQVYEKLGALLRETPAAGSQPLFLAGNDFCFNAWAMTICKDSANADVIWLETDIPE